MSEIMIKRQRINMARMGNIDEKYFPPHEEEPSEEELRSQQ